LRPGKKLPGLAMDILAMDMPNIAGL